MYCSCDPATKTCVVCGIPDSFCGSLRNCPGLPDPVHVAEPPPVEPMPTRSAPGFLTKVRNFATAAAGHVAAGMPMASDAEIIRRHDICLGCEHLQDNACTQCGCPVARVRGYVSKLSWADSECPVGKWGKATPDS
jgi:hypothetical protein